MSAVYLKFLPSAGCFCLRKPLLSTMFLRRNYWRRRDPFSELSSAVQTFENYMREMDKEMNRVFGEVQRASPIKIPRLFSPIEWGRVREIPVSSDRDGRNYKLELDMQGMEPENINITLKNDELTISARKDEKRDDGSRSVRENNYHYTLPHGINPDTIRSSLTDGILTIEAQLPAVESKEIPVKIEGDNRSSNSDSDGEIKK